MPRGRRKMGSTQRREEEALRGVYSEERRSQGKKESMVVMLNRNALGRYTFMKSQDGV